MVLAHNILESERTTDVQISRDVTFESMLLSSSTIDGLKESGFFKPSPVQLHAVPLGKCGFDLILEAKSGTGKTAVFTIIALEKLDLNKDLQVIILAPTREIAAQICDVFKQIGCKYEGLCVEVVMGGLPIQDDVKKFKEKNVHVLVASPGRLKHLIFDKHINTNSVRLLVLDEADKLMEKSFLSDIKFIHSVLPTQKQVILSSATYPLNSKDLISQFVNGAQHICPSSDCVLLGVAQKVTFVKYHNNVVKLIENKLKELLKILTKIDFKQCLIFCNYQSRVEDLHKMLIREKWPAEQLYGKQDQSDRLDAIKTLQEYKCRLLITTDLAARGIDASNVDLVINFEHPFEWQTYLHRIGRAGRYGSYGTAITILSEGGEKKKFLNMLQSLKMSISLTSLWSDEIVTEDTDEKQNVKLTHLTTPTETEDKNHIDLLKISQIDSHYINKSLESIEDLLKSFKGSEICENNLMSFSDLLNSFNDNHLSDLDESSDCQYKCIGIPDKVPKDCFNKINEIKEIILNGSPKEENNSIQNEIITCEKSASIQIENNNIQDKSFLNTASQDFDIDENKHLLHSDNNKIKKSEIENKSFDIEANNTAEILKLGLPLAFSSSKNKSRINKNKSAISTVSKNSNEKIYHKLDECDEYETENKFDSELNQTKSGYKSQRSNTTEINNPNLNKCKGTFTGSKPYQTTNIRQNNPTDYYINWYHQIKLKTKQLEFAIYIDELSK